MINLIEICKGHLLCEEEKCFRCRISSTNKLNDCYKPLWLNKEYEGRSMIRAIQKEIKALYDPEVRE